MAEVAADADADSICDDVTLVSAYDAVAFAVAGGIYECGCSGVPEETATVRDNWRPRRLWRLCAEDVDEDGGTTSTIA